MCFVLAGCMLSTCTFAALVTRTLILYKRVARFVLLTRTPHVHTLEHLNFSLNKQFLAAFFFFFVLYCTVELSLTPARKFVSVLRLRARFICVYCIARMFGAAVAVAAACDAHRMFSILYFKMKMRMYGLYLHTFPHCTSALFCSHCCCWSVVGISYIYIHTHTLRPYACMMHVYSWEH